MYSDDKIEIIAYLVILLTCLGLMFSVTQKADAVNVKVRSKNQEGNIVSISYDATWVDKDGNERTDKKEYFTKQEVAVQICDTDLKIVVVVSGKTITDRNYKSLIDKLRIGRYLRKYQSDGNGHVSKVIYTIT